MVNGCNNLLTAIDFLDGEVLNACDPNNLSAYDFNQPVIDHRSSVIENNPYLPSKLLHAIFFPTLTLVEKFQYL
jgi:hypothetical protein